MIHFTCPSCGGQLLAADNFAGQRIRCGGCRTVAVVPEAPAAVQEAPTPPRERSFRDEPPAPERYDDREDDYEPRRRPDVRRLGVWADCPRCGAPDPTRVSYTWWGGFLGPALINTVRCRECRTQYNGVHGDYNTMRIVFYTLICFAIVLPLIFGGVLLAALQ